jgi:hypothetical protein
MAAATVTSQKVRGENLPKSRIMLLRILID